ncbi:rab-GTPase-TBC domain-containing protein [Microdochium trichocladiopsis]|uniref:GTPase-activating protein GYP5 n=1 Tax=Microdochium trichocladiopsis TaxID=1682393 RepID=A0A9P9BWD1_9PEZI|nr:rab-GTPase-TBC domain-containing protein [Microdochium trichocladiopsis]KAH7040677.1 rab-GTPase-TBC domain-containing protein [Microdochium trichocladiopsis]
MSLQDELRDAGGRPQSPPSPAGSDNDKDTDTFEDAVDTSSVRSLTGRTRTPSKTSRQEQASRPTSTQERADTPDSLDKPEAASGPKDEDRDDEDEDEDEDDKSFEGVDIDGRSDNGTVTDTKRSSKRLSATTMDNVDLEDTATTTTQAPTDSRTPSQVSVPEVEAAQPAKQPRKKLSLSNIASSLPAMPWSPPANDTASKAGIAGTAGLPTAPGGTQPAAPTRKFTSPFSWMSRNSSSKDAAVSPPTAALSSPRRNTASSITTLTSNPEMMLSKLEEEDNGDGGSNAPRQRNSLRDRFKMVRMREEAGISMAVGDEDPSGGLAPNRGSTGTLDVGGPPTEGGLDVSLGPKSPIPPSPNPSLAPGTVSGITAGPSSLADAQVDWDLWQSVVYEGPAAVARTSPEELNRAIATGIPTVIRGVVWQVLAQSKNEELEVVYKELSTRGAEKKDRNSNGTSISGSSNGTLNVEKDTVASSASSVHSEVSGASGAKSPAPSAESAEAVAKLQAATKKKQQEDAAALSKLEKVIKRDMGTRTSYSKHAVAAGLQEGLFGVCKAYALFDEAVGYAQGMNFLIMPLLFNMPEEEAFCILVKLMNQYKLRDLFVEDMPGLHMHLYQFERLLEDFEPALYCHLRRRGITPHLYATQWFLTLFAYRFPLQLVLRIYDLIFSEGLSAILKFGLVLMQKNATNLLSMSDMSQLTTFLKDKIFDVYIDHAPSAGSILENGFFGSSSSSIDKEVYRADELVLDACEVKITPELLKAYTVEWEEKTRIEKDKEQELEQLRSTNLSQAIRMRKLEERLEASDREAADMATDLVQTKVRNEELSDINESLTGQVKELRNVIEKQPEELEQAWQAERADLMKRNQAVHEENLKLEKEMAELEERLVETKMQYAEINASHETLQKKWQELRRQFA